MLRCLSDYKSSSCVVGLNTIVTISISRHRCSSWLNRGRSLDASEAGGERNRRTSVSIQGNVLCRWGKDFLTPWHRIPFFLFSVIYMSLLFIYLCIYFDVHSLFPLQCSSFLISADLTDFYWFQVNVSADCHVTDLFLSANALSSITQCYWSTGKAKRFNQERLNHQGQNIRIVFVSLSIRNAKKVIQLIQWLQMWWYRRCTLLKWYPKIHT